MRRVLLRRVAAGVGPSSAMGAVSGAALLCTVAGTASVTGAALGAGGTSKAGRLSLLRRVRVGTGAVGSGSVGTGTVGITVVETGSVGAVPRLGSSAAGFVGLGVLTDAAASAR
ncbi:hypothetical protein ACW0JT_05060 [Arthrobacter sp. SA17]